jgi:hypothetical protein
MILAASRVDRRDWVPRNPYFDPISGIVPYKIAAAAQRATIRAAAHANPPLSQNEWRCLNAVLAKTASYSKLWEHIYVRDLCHYSGMGDAKRIAAKLRQLANRGLIVYRPGRGRHNYSLVRLRLREKGAYICTLLQSEKGTVTRPLLDREKGASSDGKGGNLGPEKGATAPPTARDIRERREKEEVRAAAHFEDAPLAESQNQKAGGDGKPLDPKSVFAQARALADSKAVPN